MIASFLD